MTDNSRCQRIKSKLFDDDTEYSATKIFVIYNSVIVTFLFILQLLEHSHP